MNKIQAQPWIIEPLKDIIFILSPPFISLLLVVLLPSIFQQTDEMPEIFWLILVVFVDVAHVYSTLFRTYFNPKNFTHSYQLLILIPLICYVLGVILYSIDGLLFWRILAYVAVFHFIRQQYGLMRLYLRMEIPSKFSSITDSIAIYTATLFPLLYWHFSGNRNFNWFLENDFIPLQNNTIIPILQLIYILIIALYVLKEIYIFITDKKCNIPKNLLIIGTFLSWYFGIVYFNGDMAFTTLNVISHGIPYIALIWFFEKKKSAQSIENSTWKTIFSGSLGFIFFLFTILFFAYFEEGLWDALVWQEHEPLFKLFHFIPQVNHSQLLTLLVPLLALPQATHYVLDGFIWRKNSPFSST